MRLLLDTHVLLWVAGTPERLSDTTRQLISDATKRCFSAASIWEVTIKARLGRVDFRVDARRLRTQLLLNGYAEVAVTGEHAVATQLLPDLHRDPFDRVLVAQAHVEGLTLLTGDATVLAYPGSIRPV